MFGKLLGFNKKDNKVNFEFENGKGRVEVITPEIINVFSDMGTEERISRAFDNLEISPELKVEVEKEDEKVVISTGKIKAVVYDDFKVDFYDNLGKLLCEDYRGEREPFERLGNHGVAQGEGINVEEKAAEYKIQVAKTMLGDECFFGLGDKAGHLNKKGCYYEMWNTDDPSPHVESFKSLYKSIPFFITLREKASYGIFFDNTFKSYFDMGKENKKYFYFAANEGNLSYYFMYGPKVKEVLGEYTYLTGTTPLPQLWTLGYHQSRWSYFDEKKVTEIAENFRKKDIPCDTIHLDIDYMDGYRVFTWGKDKFPEPEKMLGKLKDEGFKIVTIIDPGVKKDKGYFMYDQGIENGYFATEKDGIPYVNEVWPGEALYPDFSDEPVRKWWAKSQKIMMDYGVAGIWNDMNEPASFKGPLPDDVQFKNDGHPTDHKEIHNVYGQLMSKATYEGIKESTNKRPFVITRACYAGIQKYSTVWTGDNHSFWEHLRMSIPQLLNLGLSGVAFAGSDVGGFQYDCTGELLSRWSQVGAFTPLFRNHSCIHSKSQEPWEFDKQTEDINRKYIKLRYKLLPYLYDLLWKSENTGLPIMRPLMLHYEDDKNTYEINDQFLCGENILVAPVVEQGKTHRALYLPEGNWVDYWTKEVVKGGKTILREAPLDTCPIYIKEGSIIPNYVEQSYVGEKEMDTLILDVYAGNGEYSHYLDDGESFNYRKGEYNLYEFKMSKENELTIDVNMVNDKYEKPYKNFKFNVNGVNPNAILVNGENIEFKATNNTVEFTIPSGNCNILVK